MRLNSKLIKLFKLNIFFYFLIIFLIAEFFAFIFIYFVIPKNVYYFPKLITQDINIYNNNKHPILGWDIKNENKDKYGARNDPNSDLYQNICVEVYGNSYTYSEEVSDKNSWPAILSKLLNCRVLNYGVGGYGSDQSFIKFQIKNRKNTKVIFLNHLSENILRNSSQLRNLIYPNSEIALKPLFILKENKIELIPLPAIENNEFFYNLEKELKFDYFVPDRNSGIQNLPSFPMHFISLFKVLKHFHVKAKLMGYIRHEPFYEVDHKSNSFEVTKNIFQNFINITNKNNQFGIITIIPTCRDFQSFENNKYFPYKNLVDFLEINQIRFIDFGKEILEYESNYNKLYNTCRSHFNEYGYYLIAKIANKYLLDKNLLETDQ
tara:strand:- start:2410 stop:3543 length:1134 start_codon:yes stop_codon:yes gene_type:complete